MTDSRSIEPLLARLAARPSVWNSEMRAHFDRDLLRDALEKFGVHDISCHHTGKPLTATMRERGERWPCTCGLSAILKELEK